MRQLRDGLTDVKTPNSPRGRKKLEIHGLITQTAPEVARGPGALAQPYFLAMFSILSFFFMRGLDAAETEVSTREEVDCDT